MNSIQRLGKSYPVPASAAVRQAAGAPASAEQTAKDTYVSGGAGYDNAAPSKPLTGRQLSALSERYDLRHMTRQEYGELLRDLRDSGVITQREFGDGYSGTAPDGAHALPQGRERADFLGLLGGLAEACVRYGGTAEGSEQANAEALASSYGRLEQIFSRIDSYAQNAGAPEAPEREGDRDMIGGVRDLSAPAVKSAHQAKTAAASGSFRAAMEKAAGTEKAAQTAMPDFSRMNDRQKLAALAALHDATDYSGMTDVEKHKLIEERFEAAFPDYLAYRGGLYGPSIIYFDNPADQARHVKALPELIYDEEIRQYQSTGITDVPKLHREAYYSGMTDEETIAAICKRHPGGTMADRYCILYEMFTVGVGDKYAIGQTISSMSQSIDEQIKRSIRPTRVYTLKGLGPRDITGYSGDQLQMARQIAGSRTGWADVKALATASITLMGGRLGDSVDRELMDSIDELFDALI